MKELKIFFICIYYFFSPISILFAQRIIYPGDIPTQKIRIVLEQSMGGIVSERFSEISYIPLITDYKDRIDYVHNTSYLDDRMGIVDMAKGNFYIFSLKGELIQKISKIEGYRPPEAKLFHASKAEKENFIVYTQDMTSTVDKAGNLVDTTFSIKNKPYNMTVKLGPNNFYYANGFGTENSEDKYALKMNDSTLIRYEIRDTVHFGMGTGFGINKASRNKAFATFYNHYEIFELVPEGIHKIYDVVFPMKNSIDSTYYTNKEYKDPFSYFGHNTDIVAGIGNIMQHADYLIIQVKKGYDPLWLAYNLKTREVIDINKILPDKSNDFLNFMDIAQLFSDGEYLYSFIYPNDIRAARNKSMDEKHTMRQEYAELEKYNNPIMVRFKLR